jgi:stage V sporulation protein AE
MDMVSDVLKAFAVGGGICVIGQLLIDLTKMTPGKVLVLFVVLGVVLSAVGVYEPLVDFAGAGATTPLTGFGYALYKGTRQAVIEKGILGAVSGPFSSASVGIMAAVLCGLVVSIFAKSKDK